MNVPVGCAKPPVPEGKSDGLWEGSWVGVERFDESCRAAIVASADLLASADLVRRAEPVCLLWCPVPAACPPLPDAAA